MNCPATAHRPISMQQHSRQINTDVLEGSVVPSRADLAAGVRPNLRNAEDLEPVSHEAEIRLEWQHRKRMINFGQFDLGQFEVEVQLAEVEIGGSRTFTFCLSTLVCCKPVAKFMLSSILCVVVKRCGVVVLWCVQCLSPPERPPPDRPPPNRLLPDPPGPPTRQPENSKRAHLSAPALQTPPKFHEKDPQKTRTNFVVGEGKKKHEILSPPPFGLHHDTRNVGQKWIGLKLTGHSRPLLSAG